MNINMYIHQNVIVQIFFGLKCIIIFLKTSAIVFLKCFGYNKQLTIEHAYF